MSYTCPHCRGGFDEPATPKSPALPECPWCGTSMNGTYNPEEQTPVLSAVTTVKDSERNKPEALLPKLREWLT